MRRNLFCLGATALILLLVALVPAPAIRPAAAPSGRIIFVDLDLKRLTLYENGREVLRLPIADGSPETPTPLGIFTVNRRYVTELSGFGTRFMGLNAPMGDFAIHGTNRPASIGTSASHGCIRLRNEDAETLYALTGLGTRVVIDGGPYGAFTPGIRSLSPGHRGNDVKEMQLRLGTLGFFQGWPDGIFGENTKKAVITARKHFDLPDGDTADYALLTRLGIMQFE